MAAEITAPQLLIQIRDEGVAATVQAYRKNPLSSRTLIELFENTPDRDARLFLASYPTVPSALIEWMLETEEDCEILCALAQNPRTSQPLLIRMIENATTEVKRAMATNKQLGPRECDLLLDSDSWLVRATLAENPILTSHQQARLAGDFEPAVRLALTENKRIDPDVAIKLSNDESAVVRAQLLSKTKLEDAILQIWADSDELEKQQLLLERKSLVESIEQSLALSTHSQIRRASLQSRKPTPIELIGLVESDFLDDRLFVAEMDGLPISIQRLLAQDSHPAVRAKLASNPNIAEGVAFHIVSAGDPETCEKLAENASISEAIINELCHHEDEDVLLRLVYRTDLTSAHYDILINKRQNLEVINHLAMQQFVYAETNEELAEWLALNNSPLLRNFAANSIHLPLTHLQVLCDDPSERVRVSAKHTLEKYRHEHHENHTDSELENSDDKTILTRIVNFFAE